MKKSLGKYKLLLLFLFSIICALVCAEILIAFHIHRNNQKTEFYSQISLKRPLDLTNRIHFSAIPTETWENETDSFITIMDCSLLNTKHYDFSAWTIQLKVPENTKIGNAWNCNITLDNQVLSITPRGEENAVIKHNTERTFSFMLISDKVITFNTAKIYGKFRQRLFTTKPFVIILTLIGLLILVMFAMSVLYKFYRERMNQAMEQLRHENKIIQQTMSTFATFIDNKDPYTRGHSQRVANYTREMIKRMGYSPTDQQYAYYAGLMHDIGKITIKDEVLNKTTRLSTDEWEMIQKHTTNGAELLKNFTILPLINDAVLYHHERYDGNGYINRLKGENIPFIARVVCIADSYDAMATNRCYRLKFSEERIINELTRCAGKQFDPTIVPVMISIIADGTVYKL